MFGFGTLTATFVLGFVPAIVWLIFWLTEDGRHPEPKKLIIRAFLAGMLAVVLVTPLERLALTYLPMAKGLAGFPLIVIWAALEETIKLLVAWVVVLRKSAVEEPIDIPIYLITVALGFSALENMLFLLNPLGTGHIVQGLITGNLRFIGASLIHVLASSLIGAAWALAFYRERLAKIGAILLGVILAIVLHALFNFSILATSADHLLTVFAGVWVGIMFLLLTFERLKRLVRPPWWSRIFISKKS